MIVHEQSHSLLLKVKDPSKITAYIPQFKLLDYEGHNIAVPHRLDTVRILYNIGIKVPPPILHYYDWPHPPDKAPMAHQRETAAFLTLHPRCFVLNEPGTAKTAATLWAADYLMEIGTIRKVVIVAPLSTLDLVWKQEIFDFLMHRKVAVLHGSRQRRLDLLSMEFDFYVINHDGLDIIIDHLRGRSDIDLIIVDESAEYRNPTTDKYEALVSAIGKRRLWLLTGTPTPQAPTDAWAQVRLVNKARVPRYMSHWKNMTMLQVSTHKWVARAGSAEIVFDAMQPAIRYKKSECIDLPPVLYERRATELSAEQKKAYSTMKNQYVMAGDAATITAVNAADRINKLRQILLGAVKDPATGNYYELDHAQRTNVLLDCVRQATAKVIVIVPFKGIIGPLQRDISKHYSCDIINGDVTKNQRDDIINRFKREADPHVLLCHAKVMAHGLNLTEADMTVFYGPIYSNNEDQQVIERFNRPGQKRKMTIIQIGATPLEWGIYQQVGEHKLLQESVLALYKHEVLGLHS